MKTQFVLGIDPGVLTGFCVYSRAAKKIIAVKTMTFWSVVDFVAKNFTPDDAEIVIENPTFVSAMYARHDGIEGQRRRARLARNVGANAREAELLIERFTQLGYAVRSVAPVRARKWTSEEFKRLTKYQERTSQHARDAARIALCAL